VTRYLAEEGERLNRPLVFPWPFRMWIKLVTFFMPPERRARMKQFMGYVLFEPMAAAPSV
jgi:hypothetical protein